MENQQTKQTVSGRMAELENALMDFPDEWEMVNDFASSFVNMVRFRPEPMLRELPEGESHDPMEVQGYSAAKVQWTDEHDIAKEKYESALKRLTEYQKMRKDLTKFQDKKK